MKKNIITLIVVVFTLSSIYADDFKIRLVENDMGYMEVQMKSVNAGVTPTTSTPISGFTFQIRWATTLSADIDIVCTSNPYNLADGLNAIQTTGSYNWRTYYATGTPFSCPTTWITDEWETITSFMVTTGSGVGDFEVAINGWVSQGLNWQIENPIVFYNPDAISGITSYSFPTLIYTHVWVGGDGTTTTKKTRWQRNGNWVDQCNDASLTFPTASDNAYIPDVSGASGYFPETSYGEDTWACNDLFIAVGAHVSVPDLSEMEEVPTYFDIAGDLTIEGTLYLPPLGHATVSGITTVNSAEGIVVQADATGVGSFIDNGSIDYSELGTAMVQTFLSNAAGSGNFDIHLVGPTLNQENYGGTGTGAYLGEFILGEVDTYAYEWDETVPDDVDAWVNLSSLTEEIYSAKGIGLSTIDNTEHTLEMTGYLITGEVSSPALTFSNNHWELISNPYPSSIDFDALYTLNSGVVNDKFSLWDPAAGSWVEYAGGAGVDRFIQVGQGFFVETNFAGTFDFTNSERAHSNNAFRETMPNILTITVEGGLEGYEDIAIIRFTDEATSGYDINLEAEFWESQNSDATSLRSVTEDNLELAINALPTESLFGKDLLSVPLKFDCGYTTDYTLTFEDIESFEIGTEIYLEDTKTDEEWVYLNDNPTYTFTAAEYQSSDRFIIHFFGPTDIEELNAETIDIYSSGQYAYVRNNTQENIKMIYVYNLASELVMSTKKSDNQKFHKFWVSDNVGYYIVKVVTDTNIYTEKVLIFK